MLSHGLKLLGAFGALSLAVATASSQAARADYYVKGVDRLMLLGSFEAWIATLTIDSPSPLAPVEIVEGGSRVYVQARVSAESKEMLDGFFATRESSDSVRDATVKVGGRVSMCQRQSRNGAVEVKGVCLEKLVVSVPAGSATKVVVNGKIARLVGPMSQADLMAGLDSLSFDKEKIAMVRQFVKSHKGDGRFMRMSDVIAIFKELAFDDAKVEVAGVVADRVSDTHNLPALLEHVTFGSGKEKVSAAFGR